MVQQLVDIICNAIHWILWHARAKECRISILPERSGASMDNSILCIKHISFSRNDNVCDLTYCHFAVSIYHVNIRDRNDRLILYNFLWSIHRFWGNGRLPNKLNLYIYIYLYSYHASLSISIFLLCRPERLLLTIFSLAELSITFKTNIGKNQI